MPITIGANIAAIRTQRFFDQSTSLANKSLTRLSTGQRINSAADDAAGLAVSMTLGVRQVISSRANKNIGDGISALQIVDGALSSTSSVLARMGELAEQASNGALSYAQRQSLTKEYQQLDLELRRISQSTNLNGIDLLQGKRQSITTQTSINGLSPFAASSVTASSGDGRFVATRSGTTITLHDTEAGTRTTIDSAASASSPIAMAANGDIVYAKSNQLYYYSRTSGETRQITNSSGSEAYQGLEISADSRTVAFTSNTKYVDGATVTTSGSTYSGGTNVFSLNLDSGIVRRASTLTGATSIKLSEDGSKIGFYVDQGAAGQDVYLINMSSTAPVQRLIAQPTSLIPITIAGITNSGRMFFSSFDDLTGQNPDESAQIFSYDYASSRMSQVSRFNDGAALISSAILSTDENSLFILSGGNFTGENAGNYSQLFRLDVGSGAVTQKTTNNATLSFSGNPVLSKDGSKAYGIVGGNLASATLTSAATQINIETGTGTSGVISAVISAFEGTIRGLGGFSLNSRVAALGALDAVQVNQKNLANLLGTIGAASSRLEVASSLSSDQALQYSNARSRIIDADIAEESANLVRTSILQNVGAAILAQANQAPQLALKLLQLNPT